MNDIVIIVTGSRKWHRPDRVHLILDSYMPRTVVEGNCTTGAALHARQWLAQHGIPTRSYTMDRRHGKDAERVRNAIMLREWCRHPNVRVIGFPLPGGTWTQDCMQQALALGMLVENYGEVQL